MKVVFMMEYGPHQIGDRDELPAAEARKLIESGICQEYRGVLRVSKTRPARPKGGSGGRW